ncbi:hypothetical protein BDA96_04G304300 [Sorghum bicolor]|uniref:Uncharacterized protein n=2 Tax=Sorghum bicolor TaxID=4558 RepID=A0A921R981_SORBI|nr:hypothetical protein BDA96_04G304300 [Sorghum bicolor]OQU85649.1 hypothetical protein SORBI_3004G285450 [Sorghum bicolor]
MRAGPESGGVATQQSLVVALPVPGGAATERPVTPGKRGCTAASGRIPTGRRSNGQRRDCRGSSLRERRCWDARRPACVVSCEGGRGSVAAPSGGNW